MGRQLRLLLDMFDEVMYLPPLEALVLVEMLREKGPSSAFWKRAVQRDFYLRAGIWHCNVIT
jgi:hypothetical protein